VIDDLAILEMNLKGDILFIKQNGDLRVYNIQTRKTVINENITFIIKE